jgi:hypothetical protein
LRQKPANTLRGILLAISAAWHALAVQDEEIEGLLAKWGKPVQVATAKILAFPTAARLVSIAPQRS